MLRAQSVSELEAKYPEAVALLKEYGIYSRLEEEIHYLVKYFDRTYFLELLTLNLTDDIRGVFQSFCNRELKEIYQELVSNPAQPLEDVLQRPSVNIDIFRNCALNVRYQVSGLMRMEATRNLLFKSSFFQFVQQKLNLEIQQIYRELTNRYKVYFRKQYLQEIQENNQISLACIERKENQFYRSFLEPTRRLEVLYQAILFVHQLFRLQLKKGIEQQITQIFHTHRDKIGRALNVFLEDLKKDFIKTLDRQCRAGKEFEWIQRGFHLFLESERFEEHLQTILYRALRTIRKQVSAA